VILDDGTPQIYLDKIQSKYPLAIITKSDFYTEKIEFTTFGKRPNDYKIPIEFWIESAKNASENFILIEDDTWFVEDVNLSQLDNEITQNNVMMTKLYWIGNDIINQNKKKTYLENIILLKPKLFTIFPPLYYFIFYKFDRFKIRKTLKFLKINTLERHLAYYCIYAVAGMVFNKNYFSKVWKNHKNKVEEGLQLYNAVKYYYENKDSIQFAQYKIEVLKTGFISAATNEHKEGFDGNVDMFEFNLILNNAWLNNNLQVVDSLPNDISENEVKRVLETSKLKVNDWVVWNTAFKKMYLDYGSIVD
jgi:hypothetical protein